MVVRDLSETINILFANPLPILSSPGSALAIPRVESYSPIIVKHREGGDDEPMNEQRGSSRRRLLKVGGLGALGLTLPGLLRAEAAQGGEGRGASARGLAPIRSCILVFYYGGPSHIDTVDMKPKAPAEVRGEFGSIATSAPGLRVCEHLPHTARVMDRLAMIRAMHHPMTNHNAAAFATLCGRNPAKGDLEILGNDRNDPPCYGAALGGAACRRGGGCRRRLRCRT